MPKLARSGRHLSWAGLLLSASIAMVGAPFAVAQSTGVQADVAGNKVEPPRPHPGDVMRHWPAYPDDAREAGQEGTVVVQLRVTAKGEPEDIRVQRSSSVTSLDVAAVAAISRWKFEPGRRDGVAEDMTVSLPIRFSLPEAPPAATQD